MNKLIISVLVLFLTSCYITKPTTIDGNTIDLLIISNEPDLELIKNYDFIDHLLFQGIYLDKSFCNKLNQINGPKIQTLSFMKSKLVELEELNIRFDVESLGIVLCDSVSRFDSSLFQGSFGNEILISECSLIDKKSSASSLCTFQDLKFLELSVLGLNQIPDCYSTFHLLESLRISGNVFEEFPIQLKTISALKNLDISYNQLPLEYSCWLSKLDKLCAGSTKNDEQMLNGLECLAELEFGYWTN